MSGEQQLTQQPLQQTTPRPTLAQGERRPAPAGASLASASGLDLGLNSGVAPLGVDTLPGLGGSALARAVERWRRALLHGDERPAPGRPPTPASGVVTTPTAGVALGPAASSPADADALATLARRLDDSGCSYGRVSAARLEGVIRASDRMETKLNAVLMAVTGTFLSTLAGLLLYYVRGGGQ